MIVVLVEIRGGGVVINDRRFVKGWELLNVYEIDVLDVGGIEEDDGVDGKESFELKISSMMIRK